MKIETYTINTKKGIEKRKLYILQCKTKDCNEEIKAYGKNDLNNKKGYCKKCSPGIYLKKEPKNICPFCKNSFHIKESRINKTKNQICCSMSCKKEMIKLDKTFHNGSKYFDIVTSFLSKKFTRIKMSSVRRKYEFNLDREYFFNCYSEQKGLCYYTKIPLSFNKEDLFTLISVDRKDNNKGYVKGNIVFCCVGVNSMKFNYSSEDLFKFINLIKNN